MLLADDVRLSFLGNWEISGRQKLNFSGSTFVDSKSIIISNIVSMIVP